MCFTVHNLFLCPNPYEFEPTFHTFIFKSSSCKRSHVLYLDYAIFLFVDRFLNGSSFKLYVYIYTQYRPRAISTYIYICILLISNFEYHICSIIKIYFGKSYVLQCSINKTYMYSNY